MGRVYKIGWFLRYVFYWPFLSFRGMPSYIGKPIFLMGIHRVKIGRRFRVFPGMRLEVFPKAKLNIDDDVAIAQNFHITCKERISIGSGTCIAANVCITDIRHQYAENTDTNILGNVDKTSPTLIGKNCFIGFGAVIDAGTTLGDGCIVGANSYVRGCFADRTIIATPRAKKVSGYEK